MEDTVVKEEIPDYIKLEHSPTTITTTGPTTRRTNTTSSQISKQPIEYIDLSSSDSDSSDDSDDEQLGLDPYGKRSRVSENGDSNKKQRLDDLGFVLPLGFLDPLPPEETVSPPLPLPEPVPVQVQAPVRRCQSTAVAVVRGAKQFWKAGDYDDSVNAGAVSAHTSVGMDHVRVHPKFLHSNATSHKWALGAFAELLDNSLDEVCSGATYVNIDMLENKKDGSRMLLIEDNGGGMDPDKMRQCMSLGYSAKSKLANVIGQYGNGFKTSTMRLGADVIVFSRCCGKDSKSPTQSIGLLSYTFLKSTGKEDIVVPMLDYEKGEGGWNKLMRSSPDDWNRNAETIVQWSPYSSEAELLDQFNVLSYHGTRIIIYNLWEDDQGQLELDFCADRHDIQIRGGNRDEKKIEMARQFPNSRHFLTYRHSLRSYASILYLRLPPAFRIVLRGKDVEQHNLVNDMMLTEEVTYRPQPGADGVPKDANMVAVVTMGFVKDAEKHIDVQGFNVYHKNRLIKPFWRVWNPAGSDGRGVIGVLEANFVVPAHDKQGFERTIVLQRLEQRLVQMQKTYWRTQCHRIGYSFRGSKKLLHESSPEYSPHLSRHSDKATPSDMRDPEYTPRSSRHTPSGMKDPKHGTGHLNGKAGNGKQNSTKYGNKSFTSGPASSIPDDDSDCEIQTTPPVIITNGSGHEASTTQKSFQRNSSHLSQSSSRNSDNGDVQLDHASNGNIGRIFTRSQLKAVDGACNGGAHASVVNSSDLISLEAENRKLEDRIKELEESFGRDLELEREKIRSLEALVNDRSSQGSEGSSLIQLKMENSELKDSVKKMEEDFLRDLEFERERCRSLEAQLKESEAKMEQMNKEQEALIDIFAEERNRRDNEEVNLRKKLKDASSTIQTLLDKVRMLEKMKSTTFKEEPLATQ